MIIIGSHHKGKGAEVHALIQKPKLSDELILFFKDKEKRMHHDCQPKRAKFQNQRPQ